MCIPYLNIATLTIWTNSTDCIIQRIEQLNEKGITLYNKIKLLPKSM